jgi:hypothetical protein
VNVIAGQTVTSCIFCGSADLSDEDVFPRWLRKVLTREIVGNDIRAELTQRSASGIQESRRHRQNVASVQARVVCQKCNNEWMSRLEKAAQRYLAPMIVGEPIVLPVEAQLTLATWTSLKSFVAEFAIGTEVVATAEQRENLMKVTCVDGAVPVRIGAVERDGIPNSITRITYTVGAPGSSQGTAACTTLTLGCAVLQVRYGLGIRTDWTRLSEPGEDHIPLNPPCPRHVQWPPHVVLDTTSLARWERPIPATDPHGIQP